MRAEVDRVLAGETAVAASERGPDGVDDDGTGHGGLLHSKQQFVPGGRGRSTIDRSVKTTTGRPMFIPTC
jgi:hypothetical protein